MIFRQASFGLRREFKLDGNWFVVAEFEQAVGNMARDTDADKTTFVADPPLRFKCAAGIGIKPERQVDQLEVMNVASVRDTVERR